MKKIYACMFFRPVRTLDIPWDMALPIGHLVQQSGRPSGTWCRVRNIVVRQKDNVHYISFRDFLPDAVCVNTHMDQITRSLPLLLHSSVWQPSARWEPFTIAYNLLLTFYARLPDEFRQVFLPQTTQHKKREIDVEGVIFIEEQYHGNQPAFCFLRCGTEETFHLYSAMGLQHLCRRPCTIITVSVKGSRTAVDSFPAGRVSTLHVINAAAW